MASAAALFASSVSVRWVCFISVPELMRTPTPTPTPAPDTRHGICCSPVARLLAGAVGVWRRRIVGQEAVCNTGGGRSSELSLAGKPFYAVNCNAIMHTIPDAPLFSLSSELSTNTSLSSLFACLCLFFHLLERLITRILAPPSFSPAAAAAPTPGSPALVPPAAASHDCRRPAVSLSPASPAFATN